MKIIKMTATFGTLENAVLTPGEGLTVITAPNEAGKSTWAGFLKAMLYGIDTRERDKAGFLADKNRYQPWSGAPMAGEIRLDWQGQDITLRRFATKTNPFGGFEAVYTASGDPVPSLTAANAGEQLTGVTREVFLRSAFLGQNAAAVSQNGELEARITALATSGQEDVSYSAVERRLKDWRNRRRANRASGLIPELEEELRDLERTLREMEDTRSHMAQIDGALRDLAAEEEAVEADLAIYQRLEKHELNRRCAQALVRQEELTAALSAMSPPDEELADKTAQEAHAWAAEQRRQYEDALRRREHALTEREALLQKEARPARLLLAAAILLAVAAFALFITGGLGLHTIPPSLCCAPLFAAFCCFWYRNQRLRQNARRVEDFDIPAPPVPSDWEDRAQRHSAYLSQRESCALELRHTRQRAEDLAAQGAQPFDTLELLHTPEQQKPALTARLIALRAQIEQLRGQKARREGALAQMGDSTLLEERRGQLREQLDARLEEYDAITQAMGALSDANDTLRQRFSPALNRAAGEIFSALTGGRWPALSLSRDFSAQATREGDLLPRSALSLSAGTVDQLYLALRLAICKLTVPDAPLLLDDTLAAFDDERAALALTCLADMGRERQILLFSCHSREADWARAHNIPAARI